MKQKINMILKILIEYQMYAALLYLFSFKILIN